jgi:hypothetical protein
MTAVQYPLFFELKVEGLVEAFMQVTGKTLNEALSIVYHSQVYRVLERENTKLWHHSPQLLLDCLNSELRTGRPEFPDE